MFLYPFMKNYIIVGLGLSGLNLVHELEKRNKSFIVFENHSQSSSRIAGGMSNPLILKRFTKAWNAENFLPTAKKQYQSIAKKLNTAILKEIPVYRKIKSTQEQNDWFVASDQKSIKNFMNPKLQSLPLLENDFKYGEVRKAFLVNTSALFKKYETYLRKKELLLYQKFNHHELKIHPKYVEYKNIKAKKIIFAEGYGIKNNPYFKALPLIGNKGEYLILEIPNIKLQVILKTALALIPLGNNLYKFGATYSRDFKDDEPEESAHQFLIKKLHEAIEDRPYKHLTTEVGIRPTVLDRKPLIGRHPAHNNLLLLNGLGSHGVMIAPTAAKWLLDFDIDNKPLAEKVNLQRYLKA